eukprot:scaffold1635_cov124-Skeletonema_dohrnii-CCMP3373.AAC.5
MANYINNHSIDDEDEASEEAGVEIIPIEADETEDREANNVAVADPKLSKTNKGRINACGLVLAAVGVVSYVASSSASSNTTNFIRSSQMQNQQQGGLDFDYVGDGWCLDGSDPVSTFPFVGYRYQVSAEECGEVCSECPGKGQEGLVLRGFQMAIYPDSNPDVDVNSECFCLVDANSIDPTFDFSEMMGECNGAVFWHGENPGDGVSEGIGEIESFSYNKNSECWKVSSKGSKAKATKR